MLQQLKSVLAPFRMRQRIDRALQWGTSGFLFGSLLGSAWLLAAWFGMVEPSGTAWNLLIGSGASALVAGLLFPTSWRSSAYLVDSVVGLKDRATTALDFASQPHREPLQMLQVRDAIQHLSKIDARQVLPWKAPRQLPLAAAAVAVMVVLAILPPPPAASVENAAPEPLQVVLEQAELLEETVLADLDELAEETEDPEIEQLAEEIRQAVEELKDPEVDRREALAQISEMQASLAAAMEQLTVEQTDAHLQQLAEALQIADATQAASQSLLASEYDQAADQLENIDISNMSRKQRDGVAASLAKLRSKLSKGKQGQLSDAVQEMMEGLENGNESQCKSGFCKAAGVCRRQSLKKRIGECLGCQLNRLSACKGACQGSGFKPSSGVAKSQSPSNSAGSGASNQPFGELATKLDSSRRDEDLTGIAGDGPSERETLSSAEARQNANRSYRERYLEYRKQMEEVIDREPLPLGHRETVRRYFESIRPTNSEAEVIASP